MENNANTSGENNEVQTLIEQLNNESFDQTNTVIEEAKAETNEGPKQPNPNAPVDEPITAAKAQSMAQRWVKTFSSVMKFGFSFLYKKTILQPGDEKAMGDFVRDHKGQSEKEMQDAIHTGHPLFDVSNRFEKYMKAVEEIPLSQDEIDSIAEPLQELIIKYKNLQLGPEWMLVISVGIVMLPRLSPMIDFNKIFTPKK